MKWRKREVREPKRRHKPIGARTGVKVEERDEGRERVSKWKKYPPPGDSITVVLRGGKCIGVTVRAKRVLSTAPLKPSAIVYSERVAPTLADDGADIFLGVAGIVSARDRGITWAWGWTTPEARALEVAARLGA